MFPMGWGIYIYISRLCEFFWHKDKDKDKKSLSVICWCFSARLSCISYHLSCNSWCWCSSSGVTCYEWRSCCELGLGRRYHVSDFMSTDHVMACLVRQFSCDMLSADHPIIPVLCRLQMISNKVLILAYICHIPPRSISTRRCMRSNFPCPRQEISLSKTLLRTVWNLLSITMDAVVDAVRSSVFADVIYSIVIIQDVQVFYARLRTIRNSYA